MTKIKFLFKVTCCYQEKMLSLYKNKFFYQNSCISPQSHASLSQRLTLEKSAHVMINVKEV